MYRLISLNPKHHNQVLKTGTARQIVGHIWSMPAGLRLAVEYAGSQIWIGTVGTTPAPTSSQLINSACGVNGVEPVYPESICNDDGLVMDFGRVAPIEPSNQGHSDEGDA